MGLYGIVYMYTNLLNKKVYIGQTVRTIAKRRSDHLMVIRYSYKKGQNMPFILAVKKYGFENFKEDILFSAFDKESLDWAESYFMNQFNSLDKKFGYNLKSAGSSGKHSPETIEKIRQANFSEKRKSIYKSDTFRQKCKLNAKFLFTKESKEKAAFSKRGKKPTEDQLRCLSIGWRRGLLPSERYKRKIIAIKDGVDFIGFRSIKDAGDFFNIAASSIGATLKGKNHSSAGLKWRYE